MLFEQFSDPKIKELTSFQAKWDRYGKAEHKRKSAHLSQRALSIILVTCESRRTNYYV